MSRNLIDGSNDELRDEYEFDYSQAQPNRFASRIDADCLFVPLDPDVARVFNTSEAVNKALRALIAAMPEGEPE